MAKFNKQISLGYDPITGARIRVWIHADSKTALKQAEKDAIAEHARSGTPSQVKFKDYQDQWFKAYKGNVEPRTKATYQSVLKYTEPLHRKKMKDITRTDLQKTINELWDKPEMCAKYISLIRHMWRTAVGDGICSKDITLGLNLPKHSKSTRRPLREAELDAIPKADFTTMEQFLVDVLLQFGLRPGEALALNTMAFNKADRTLTIDKAVSYNGNSPYIKSTKTGVVRVLPVPDSFWPKIPETKELYYFMVDGQLMTQSQSNAMSNSIIHKINIAMGGNSHIRLTDMTLYNFRHHKASTLYYLPGVSIKKKAQYMGHSEEMFLRTYSHMMEEKEDTEALRAVTNL